MDEAEILAAVAARVAAGDYVDWVAVRPGELDGGGRWVVRPGDSAERWIIERGSSEHLAASAAGAADPLPALAPATPEAVDEAEQLLGYRLPSLLRRIYLEVANGGFGPDVLGVAGGHRDDRGRTAVDMLRDGGDPPGLFAVASWGCAIVSYVDCREPGGVMWGFDPNSGRGRQSFYSEGYSLAEWFERWLTDRLRQPRLSPSPVTGE